MRTQETGIDFPLSFQWEMVDPWNCLGACLEKAKKGFIRKNLSFIRMAGSPIPRRFRMDKAKLAAILNALIDNACRYTSQGFVILNVFLRPDPLVWRLVFEVRDSGQGMPPSAVHRFNLGLAPAEDSSTKETGLARSLRHAKALGCSMQCESVLEQGSAFRFEVPMDPSELSNLHHPSHEALNQTPPEEPQPARPPIRTFTGNALLVDDNPDTLTIISYHLRKLGLMVDLAANGAEACDKALSGNHQIIFMDQRMPKMDGPTATKHLRTLGYDRPIVGLTASPGPGDREVFLEVGGNDWLKKPISSAQLVESLSEWLKPSKTRLSQTMTLKSEYADDPDILPLIRVYLESLDGMVKEVQAALNEARFAEAASIAHKIKGSGGMYGYPGITQAALELEKAFVSGQKADLEPLINLIEQAKADPSLAE